MTPARLTRTPMTSTGSMQFFLYTLLVLFAMLPGYWLIRFGLNMGDEPYQILNTMDIHRNPLAPLTTLLGGIVGQATDYNWMAYRYFALTLNNIAFIIGGLYLYRQTGSVSRASLTVAVVAFLSGISKFYHNLFGWDSLTALFVILLIFSLLLYVQKPGADKLIFLILTAIVLTACRLPNAVAIPLVFLLLAFRAWKKGSDTTNSLSSASPWVFLIASTLGVIALLCALYGSPSIYLHDLKTNALGDHSAARILRPLVLDSIYITALGVGYATTVYTVNHLLKKTHRAGLTLLLGAGTILWLTFFATKMILTETQFDVSWVILAIVWLACVLLKDRDNDQLFRLAAIALSGLVCIFGSNTGLVKYPGFLLVPFLMAFIFPLVDLRKIKFFSAVIAVTCLLLLVKGMVKAQFFDDGILKTRTLVTDGRAKGIYTTAEKAETILEIEADKRQTASARSRIIAGEDYSRFVYEYIFGITDAYAPHNWPGTGMLDDPNYIEWLKKRMAESPDPAVIYIKRPGDEPSLMKDYLDNTMRPVSEGRTTIIYVN